MIIWMYLIYNNNNDNDNNINNNIKHNKDNNIDVDNDGDNIYNDYMVLTITIHNLQLMYVSPFVVTQIICGVNVKHVTKNVKISNYLPLTRIEDFS
uniref:Uncharacterized protein n=1 Tax=Octopus bimaculoides TaxID=37653 RepID=A0A0L8IFR0_OCTBM